MVSSCPILALEERLGERVQGLALVQVRWVGEFFVVICNGFLIINLIDSRTEKAQSRKVVKEACQSRS